MAGLRRRRPDSDSGPAAVRPVRWRAAVLAAVAFVGLLFVTSAVTAGGAELRGSRDRLPDLVGAKQDSVEALRAELDALRGENTAVAGGSGLTADTDTDTADTAVAAARAQADVLAAPAGLTSLRGPAVTVTLSDAPRESRGLPLAPGVPEPRPDDLVVHQQDVQAVVNALWTGGAEAMTIMDRRVTALTAVRCVGNTLQLHGNVFSPPFVIKAIGDTDRMVAALDAEPGVALYRRYVDAYHLGYQVEVSGEAVLPAYEGPTDLQVAHPALPGPSTPPAP